MNFCSHTITFQTDLEKNKAGEISKLQAALREMEQWVAEATEMQERELATKVIEEALAQEREKITLLTNEIEELKVLFAISLLFYCKIKYSYSIYFMVNSKKNSMLD